MRRFFSSLFILLVFSIAVMAQRMSDDQVVNYLKEASQQGKSQNEMGSELLRRGVTRQQLERIKAQYENSEAAKIQQENSLQERQRISPSSKSDDELVSVHQLSTLKAPDTSDDGKKVFGMNFFTTQYLSFEPSTNMATPVNYRLGPGDEVIIDIWGASETSIRQVISPEGSIFVSNIGPVYLSGRTIKEATNYLQREFTKIYSGISENTSQITLTLGQNRTIRINIMGEVKVPGTYMLSSFSTVFHALYKAGGVNSIGGLRDIQVIRDGKVIANVDVYKYIIDGKTDIDIRLMEEDVILVNPYESLVQITGKVKRPMYYEMKKGETVSTLLNFSGGFTGDSYSKSMRLIRLSSGNEKQIFNVDEMYYSVFQLSDGDVVSVEAVLDRFENMVEIIGAVYREGKYQFNGSVNSVKALIQKAEGLRGDAYLDRVQLQRQREDFSLELMPINLVDVLNGTVADIPLRKDDILYIPSVHDLQEEKSLTIHGYVAFPGTYLYADNMTVNDLIIQAGGLREAASTARVDVARRVKNAKSLYPENKIGESFSFELKDGAVVGDDGFELLPFDEVYIRRSPVYHTQQNITLSGEIVFGGNYALSKKNERITDVINRAGGLTNDAYIRGARLVRQMSPEEIRRKQDALRMVRTSSDSISVETLDFSTTYPVGFNLQDALLNPGSDADLVLRPGDQLFIPEYINTVKINGAVMYPNTVVFKPGKKLKYYVEQAGGYGNMAKKSKVYVVYMNGTVARLKSRNSTAIEPGCEIIVPRKEERKRLSTGEIIGISTSMATLGTMVATLVNLISK